MFNSQKSKKYCTLTSTFYSTLLNDLHLPHKKNLPFEQICDKKYTVIEYDPRYNSDVRVSNNKLVKRSNDDPDGYWPWLGPNVKMPDYRLTDTVGDTELISTFIEKSKITYVTWIAHIHNRDWIEDVRIRQFWCTARNGNQCVPPSSHLPRYIWTAPQQQGLAM